MVSKILGTQCTQHLLQVTWRELYDDMHKLGSWGGIFKKFIATTVTPLNPRGDSSNSTTPHKATFMLQSIS